MSHEGIRAFDNRSDAEIKRDRKDDFRKKAKEQLFEKMEISHFHDTESEFWKDQQKISALAFELEERAQLRRLEQKYRR